MARSCSSGLVPRLPFLHCRDIAADWYWPVSQRDARDTRTRTPRPPRIAMAMMLGLIPLAERDEVAAELDAEFVERAVVAGKANATRWFWQQTVRSLPALLRRSWWRGWTGFEPRANRMRPGGFSMESWIMDARYAARRLVRRPLYATLAVLTLALGIGGTAAIFGIARTILLDPLPYRTEQELASFWMPRDWTEEEFLYLRGRFPGFASVAAYYPDDATLEMGDGPARLVPGLATSAELFTVLGVAPALGTGFQTGQDVVGAEPVAVLSHGLWQELGGDRAIIGRTVRFDGVPRTIVGVMPPGFWFPNPTTRVWLAQRLSPENRSGNYALVGRVAPGQRVEAMGAPLETLRRMLDERFNYPAQWDKTREPSLTPL